VETPEQAIEDIEENFAAAKNDDEPPLTIQVAEIEIDASSPYHDFQLVTAEADAAAFVIDSNNPAAVNVGIGFDATYWGRAGYIPVSAEEGAKIGEPRIGTARLEIWLDDVWQPVAVEQPQGFTNFGLEVTFFEVGRAISFGMMGALTEAEVNDLIEFLLPGVDIAQVDPSEPAAQVQVRVSIVDPEGENLWCLEGEILLAGEEVPDGPLLRLRRIGT